MTNEQIEELKKLAEAATWNEGMHVGTYCAHVSEFQRAANPAAIKELLSELSTLRAAASAPNAELTDEQIVAAWDAQRKYHGAEPCKVGHLEFAREIERAVLAASPNTRLPVKTWQQRVGLSPNYAAPTDDPLCIAMAAEIADLRAVLAQAAPVADKTAEYKRMLEDACLDLARINEAVGADPEVGGAGPIIEAIDAMKAKLAAPVAAVPDHWRKRAEHIVSGKLGIAESSAQAIMLLKVMLAAAPAAPVAAAVPAGPLASFTGTMIEIGDMKAGRGFAVEIAEDTYVEVVGLTEAEVTNVAAQFYASVTIQVFPAAPAPDEASK